VILRVLRLERVVCDACGIDNLHRRSRPLPLDARCWGCSAYLFPFPEVVLLIKPRLDEFNAAMARLAATFATLAEQAATSCAAIGRQWAAAMAATRDGDKCG
jgi:hypothetical protein